MSIPSKPVAPEVPVRKGDSEVYSAKMFTLFKWETGVMLDYINVSMSYIDSKSDLNEHWGGIATGSIDTYAIATNPVQSTYEDGEKFTCFVNAANSGACTLNVDGLGALPVRMIDGSIPPAGVVFNYVSFIFDSSSNTFLLFAVEDLFLHANPSHLTSDITLAAGENASLTGPIYTNGHNLTAGAGTRLRIV